MHRMYILFRIGIPSDTGVLSRNPQRGIQRGRDCRGCGKTPGGQESRLRGLKPGIIVDAYAVLKRRSSTVVLAVVVLLRIRARESLGQKSKAKTESKAADRSVRSTRATATSTARTALQAAVVPTRRKPRRVGSLGGGGADKGKGWASPALVLVRTPLTRPVGE
jgi:hypothetical protein